MSRKNFEGGGGVQSFIHFYYVLYAKGCGVHIACKDAYVINGRLLISKSERMSVGCFMPY